jgi:spermidine/putrescine transport system ATP-binding protein
MSDRIAVMRAGVVEQVGPGDEIYANPNTAFVASFVGEANMQQGRIARAEGGAASIETTLGAFEARNPHALPVGAKALLFVRPEAIAVSVGDGAPGANRIEARLVRRDLEGPFVNLFFDAAGREIAVHHPNDARAAAVIGADRHILSFGADQALLLPEGPMASTGRELAAT